MLDYPLREDLFVAQPGEAAGRPAELPTLGSGHN